MLLTFYLYWILYTYYLVSGDTPYDNLLLLNYKTVYFLVANALLYESNIIGLAKFDYFGDINDLVLSFY
jgi:hypothetical protein